MKTLAQGLVLAFSLATAVCVVSNNLHARVVHRDESVAQQRALISRQPLVFDGRPGDLPEFRNRVLVPLAMEALVRVFALDAREAFLALRWITAFACFLTLWWYATNVVQANVFAGALGLALLANFFVLSFNHPWEHPTDFPDAIVMTLGAWSALRGRLAAAAAIAVLGAANRESAAFVGILWMFVRSPATPGSVWPARIQGAALIVAALASTTLLRAFWGLPGTIVVNSLGVGDARDALLAAWRAPFMSWPMLATAGLLPLAGVWWWSGAALNTQARQMAAAGWIVAAISVIIGRPTEIRILIPAAAILICAMLAECRSNARPA